MTPTHSATAARECASATAGARVTVPPLPATAEPCRKTNPSPRTRKNLNLNAKLQGRVMQEFLQNAISLAVREHRQRVASSLAEVVEHLLDQLCKHFRPIISMSLRHLSIPNSCEIYPLARLLGRQFGYPAQTLQYFQTCLLMLLIASQFAPLSQHLEEMRCHLFHRGHHGFGIALLFAGPLQVGFRLSPKYLSGPRGYSRYREVIHTYRLLQQTYKSFIVSV